MLPDPSMSYLISGHLLNTILMIFTNQHFYYLVNPSYFLHASDCPANHYKCQFSLVYICVCVCVFNRMFNSTLYICHSCFVSLNIIKLTHY